VAGVVAHDLGVRGRVPGGHAHSSGPEALKLGDAWRLDPGQPSPRSSPSPTGKTPAPHASPPAPTPLGRDPDKTAQTFRVIDGRRYALAGDYAQVDADGTIRLLGRGSACINTGGEKVYPEEVELVLRKHPSVFDCVAVGVPDDRFSEIVVALVQVTEGHYLDEPELEAWCRSKLAGFKKPRRFLFVDSLERRAYELPSPDWRSCCWLVERGTVSLHAATLVGPRTNPRHECQEIAGFTGERPHTE
jgi:acyl-CoA synthetase (AMP-forming)/AMP-acid ligase II